MDECPKTSHDTKPIPLKSVGTDGFEIAVRYETDAYRTALAVPFGKKIYVLNAFQRKSKKGIEIPPHRFGLIQVRYEDAKDLAIHEE
jgi:phage-related protein